jgi:hypothetical protein
MPDAAKQTTQGRAAVDGRQGSFASCDGTSRNAPGGRPLLDVELKLVTASQEWGGNHMMKMACLYAVSIPAPDSACGK